MLSDLETNEPWYYPLFFLWLSTGLRNGEIRGLTWDCIRWEEGEVIVMKSLRRDGTSGLHMGSHQDGKAGVVPLTPRCWRPCSSAGTDGAAGIYDPYGLVFVTPTSYNNIYDHLVGRVWHRSLERCGLNPAASTLSVIPSSARVGNGKLPADLAAAAVAPRRCCWIPMPSQQAD